MKYTLENVTVPNPCQIGWEQMTGSDEIRHCAACQHKVYNISEMPKRRALKVLNQPEDKVCVSYHLDEQNKIVTQNYFGIFKRNFVKLCTAFLAVIFSFNSLYAIQTKPSTSKRKKVVRHRKQKKRVKPPTDPPRPFIGKRAIEPPKKSNKLGTDLP